jgi:phage gp36-like protein
MYCQLSDIVLPNGEITQSKMAELTTYKGETPVEVRQDRVDALILDNTKLINGYLRGVYPLPSEGEPFGDEGSIVEKICVKLTIYDLYKRKLAGGIPELYKGYRSEAISQLLDIQKGRIILDTGSEEEVRTTINRTISKVPEIMTDSSISKAFTF